MPSCSCISLITQQRKRLKMPKKHVILSYASWNPSCHPYHCPKSITAMSPPYFPLDCPLLSPPSLSFTLVLALLWPLLPLHPLSRDPWALVSSLPAQFTEWMAALKPISMQKCLRGESLAPLGTQLLGTLLRGRNYPAVMPSECQTADCCGVSEVRDECWWSSKKMKQPSVKRRLSETGSLIWPYYAYLEEIFVRGHPLKPVGRWRYMSIP